jgi:hypothetical protein
MQIRQQLDFAWLHRWKGDLRVERKNIAINEYNQKAGWRKAKRAVGKEK